MPEDAPHDPYHPSNWANGGRDADKDDQQLHELTAAHRAFLAWLTDQLALGGWTSLGQATKRVTKLDSNGKEINQPQLGVDQSTLSRWLAVKTLPLEASLRMVLDGLNERIHERQQATANTSVCQQPVQLTTSEVTHGLQLLKTARTPTGDLEPPPHHINVPTGSVEADSAWEQQCDRYDRLHAKWEMAREAANSAWENYWERCDRLYAQFEMAQEAAEEEKEEKLKAQYKNSALRAGIWIAKRERDRATGEARKLKEQMKAQETERSESIANRPTDWELYGIKEPLVDRPAFESALPDFSHVSDEFLAAERAGHLSVIDGGVPYTERSVDHPADGTEVADAPPETLTHSPESERESENVPNDSPGPTSHPLTISSKIYRTATMVAAFALAVATPAMGPVILMSGAWAFWFGIPWGDVRDQQGKSLSILIFIAVCLLVSCTLIAAPPFLAKDS